LAHFFVDHSGGVGRPDFSDAAGDKRPENTRGRLGHNKPLESVRRVKIQERIDRWIGQAMAWLMRKLLARVFPNAGPQAESNRASSGGSAGPRLGAPPQAIPLYRDPECGTYVSPEISFPLEQPGQVLHFCSEECRTRYQRSSQRAASA
jgi:YHS domain-containing protein